MAAKVQVDVTADGTGFHRTMSGIEKRIEQFKKLGEAGETGNVAGIIGGIGKAGIIAGVGAVAFGVVAKLTEHLMDFSHEILELSERMEISTDDAQKLKYAIENMGKDIGTVEKYLNNANKFASTAAYNPGSTEGGVAARLGLSQTDLLYLNNIELVKKAAEHARQLGLTIDQAAPLLDVVGGKRSGRTLYLLVDKMKDIDTITKENLEAFEHLRSTLTNVKNSLLVFSGTWLAPIIDFILLSIKTLFAIIKNGLAWMVSIVSLDFAHADELVEKGRREILEAGVEYLRIGAQEKDTRDPRLPNPGDKDDFKMLGSNDYLKVGGLLGIDPYVKMIAIAEQSLTELKAINSKLTRSSESRPSAPSQVQLSYTYKGQPIEGPITPQMIKELSEKH